MPNLEWLVCCCFFAWFYTDLVCMKCFLWRGGEGGGSLDQEVDSFACSALGVVNCKLGTGCARG